MCNKVGAPKQFIAENPHICLLVIINADPDASAIFIQEIPQNLQAWPNQRKPETVFQIIIVMLKSRTYVVRRINIDALHLSGVFLLQRLQRQQVIPVDEHILRIRVARRIGQGAVFDQ